MTSVIDGRLNWLIVRFVKSPYCWYLEFFFYNFSQPSHYIRIPKFSLKLVASNFSQLCHYMDPKTFAKAWIVMITLNLKDFVIVILITGKLTVAVIQRIFCWQNDEHIFHTLISIQNTKFPVCVVSFLIFISKLRCIYENVLYVINKNYASTSCTCCLVAFFLVLLSYLLPCW